MPTPLTPAGLDLRDFSWMPLEVVRLRDSNLVVVASAEAFRAAVLLWCAAWHQVPAASLPDDDRLLANLAGFGRDVKTWKTVRDDALHGFVACDDGRLYHPVIAEKAIEADEKRSAQRERTAAATRARRRVNRNDPPETSRDVQRDDPRNNHQGTRPDQRGPEDPPSPSLRSVEGGSARAQASGIETTWVPSDATLIALEEGGFHSAQVAAELPKFRAHFRGTGETRADWGASFEKWMLDGRERGLVAPAPAQVTMTMWKGKLGDPEWDAWRAYYVDNSKKFTISQLNEAAEQGRSYTFPSRWPPGHPGTGNGRAIQVTSSDQIPQTPIKNEECLDIPDYLRRKVG